MGAASDSGDMNDWSNQRMVYAILSLVIIFVFGVDSEVFMETPRMIIQSLLLGFGV